jgi:hypothetical protein
MRTEQHCALYDALVAQLGRATHQSGLSRLAAECKRGQRLRPHVEDQELKNCQGERNGPSSKREDEEGDDLGCGVGKDVEDELADVVVDAAAGLDRRDDGREVVVREHHRRRFSGHIRAGTSHRDTDVGAT